MKNPVIIISLVLVIFCSCGNPGHNAITPSLLVGEQQEQVINQLSTESTFLVNGLPVSTIFQVAEEKDSIHSIRISFVKDTDTTSTIIQRTGYLYSADDNACTDVYDRQAFICWIDEPFYTTKPNLTGLNDKHYYDIHLRILDLGTKTVTYDKKIYSTKCCIDRLSMIFNPFTNSVHFSWNDYSRSDSRCLMFGSAAVESGKLKTSSLEPNESLLQDKSEKRSPGFLRNGHSVFLYHTTGDRWGAFSHTGKQQIGISSINKMNQLVDYRMITDSCAIFEKIVLVDDTVFFRVRIENTGLPDRMVLKKVAVKDMPAFD